MRYVCLIVIRCPEGTFKKHKRPRGVGVGGVVVVEEDLGGLSPPPTSLQLLTRRRVQSAIAEDKQVGPPPARWPPVGFLLKRCQRGRGQMSHNKGRDGRRASVCRGHKVRGENPPQQLGSDSEFSWLSLFPPCLGDPNTLDF